MTLRFLDTNILPYFPSAAIRPRPRSEIAPSREIERVTIINPFR
jgi:hypothetical protein